MLGLMATVSGHPSSTTSGKPQKTFTKRKSEVLDYSEDEEEKTDGISSTERSAELELAQYLNDKDEFENPLEFWKVKKEYRWLDSLAQSHFCAPATTAGVEKLFSIVGHILSSRRLSTNDKYFEMQLYCNVNKDLIPVVHAKRCYKLDY